MAEMYAGLELGTSAARLVIGRVENDGIVDVQFQETYVHGLAGDLINKNHFDDENVNDLAIWFAHARKMMLTHNVTRANVAATEVIRSAENSSDLMNHLFDESGLNIRPLSHQDEVALSIAGNRHLLKSGAKHTLFVESGAGSTEFALLDANQNMVVMSGFKLGAATFAERFERDDFSDTDVVMWMDELEATFRESLATWGVAFDGKIPVVIAGAPVFVMRFYSRLTENQMNTQEGRWTTAIELQKTLRSLIDLGSGGRRQNPFIYYKSAHLLAPATMLLLVILRMFHVEGFTVGSGGLGKALVVRAAEGEGQNLGN